MCSQTGLRCIRAPYYNTWESKQQNSVSENASSCVCRDETVIPTLNLASAYWLLQSIDNSSRKRRGCKREWEKVLVVSLSRSCSSTYTHTYTRRHIKYAELGLAQGHFSYISIKQYIISLRLEAYDWCACHLFDLYCQPSKKMPSEY